MFTRYSDIEVPKNYGGNRFGRNRIEDTTTKTHTMQPQGAASSITLSPSFEEKISSVKETKSDTPSVIITENASNKYIERDYNKQEDTVSKDIDINNNANNEGDNEKSIFNENKETDFSYEERANTFSDGPDDGANEEIKIKKSDNVSQILPNKSDEKRKRSSAPLNSGLSRIADLLEKSSPEDLLLVMLIILLASDTENKNDDIALTLALLLLSDKNKRAEIGQ